MGNKKLGLAAFLSLLVPAWFSGIAPVFLLFSLFALIISVRAFFSERADKSEEVRIVLYVLLVLGGISSIFLIYELMIG
ncbi:hypothetical protein TH61_14220 [Rufibacter sp. DG15C]|uniref:hypothetical protein n=1 Tax=Rufibacter sp. DG15C TaxID=1379909 RepID=UPI00078D8071|nr:hypothetical protein [Rufibacter sp. DG15C]AMM52112.1 hypothetical protein TH61_14220 [Rufibacter sp. DG15C]